MEKRLKELEDEEIDRKNYMNEYSEEMGKIMGVFEQKAKEIMRLQNNGQLRKKTDINNSNNNNINFNTGISTNPRLISLTMIFLIKLLKISNLIEN